MKKILLTPGPTSNKKEFLEAMIENDEYHRLDSFIAMFKECKRDLKQLLGINQGDVVLLTSSGTGGLEAGITNLLNPNDTVLIISNGYFGQRLVSIAKQYECQTIVLEYPLGKTYDLEEVKNVIENTNHLKAVIMVYHETSSGVINALQPLGEIISQQKDCLFIVDAISGFLVHPLPMDAWHVDCVIASSQKGFLIPPGLSILGLSDKAIQRIHQCKRPRFYFDLTKYLNDQIPYTPNVSLIKGLSVSCQYLLSYPLLKYQERHKQYRLYLESRLKELGLNIDYSDEKIRGNVLVLVDFEEDVSSLYKQLLERNIVVATGLGERGKQQLRIGLIGNVSYQDLNECIKAFSFILKKGAQYES